MRFQQTLKQPEISMPIYTGGVCGGEAETSGAMEISLRRSLSLVSQSFLDLPLNPEQILHLKGSGIQPNNSGNSNVHLYGEKTCVRSGRV